MPELLQQSPSYGLGLLSLFLLTLHLNAINIPEKPFHHIPLHSKFSVCFTGSLTALWFNVNSDIRARTTLHLAVHCQVLMWMLHPGYTLRWPCFRLHLWSLNFLHLCFFISFTSPPIVSLFQPNCDLFHACATPCSFSSIKHGWFFSFPTILSFLKSFLIPSFFFSSQKSPFLTHFHTHLSLTLYSSPELR